LRQSEQWHSPWWKIGLDWLDEVLGYTNHRQRLAIVFDVDLAAETTTNSHFVDVVDTFEEGIVDVVFIPLDLYDL
jgi:hypothetical protein